MPDARKRAVLSLAQRHDIVIFEDDVYGELATEYPRPRTIHSWDIDGRVLLCSSFSKSIAPGLRVGWVAPGRYHDKLMHMKYAISSFNVPSTQMARQRLCWKVTIIAISGGCGRAISAIWRFIPAGYGNIFPAKSVLRARKADFYCG